MDLTNPALQDAFGVTPRDLTSKNWRICQDIAQIAADQGFDAVLGPSAAEPGATTLAVFGSAITDNATSVEDLGVATPVAVPLGVSD